MTWLEIILFYLLPLLYMCIDQNAPSALLFTFLGLFSGLRHYLNPGQLLQQIGPGYFRRRNGLNKSEWKNKNRFYKIAELGSDSSRSFWTAVYGFLVVFFMLTVIVAARDAKDGSTEDENYGLYEGSEVATFVSGFRYDPQPHLPYPTCQLKKGLELGNENAALVDYAFLSRMAYAVENDTQPILDIWFGENVTKNNVELVTEFRSVDSELNFDSTAVSYKVITFPNNPGVAIVTIKGTSTIWDVMADAQLWLSAGLFQGLRELLPLGNVFTPILHKMVKFVSALETKSIDKVSYYKETKRLVDYLKETGYTSVHVTGHSLGKNYFYCGASIVCSIMYFV